MSLRSKIALILTAVVVLYACVDNGMVRLVARKVFRGWEQEDGKQKLGQVRERIATELDDLEGKARVWASFEPVFHGLRADRFPSLAKDRGRVLEAAHADLFYLLDEDGTVLWRAATTDDAGNELRVYELPSEALGLSHPLLNVRAGYENVTGLMMTSRGPLLVSASPVPDGDGEALLHVPGDRFAQARYGTVILGRFLDEGLRSTIGEVAGAAVSIYSSDELDERQGPVATGHQRPERISPELLSELTTERFDVVSAAGDNGRLYLYDVLPDVRTGVPLVLEASIEREITARGERAVNYALTSTLSGSLLILLVLMRVLRRAVIRPLATLTHKAVEVGKTDDTSIRVAMDRKDEIGQLSTEFDRMLDKLDDSRKQVIRTARLAGMSEIATGVLHNVGNVLNSVNVSANLVTKKAEQLSVRDLEKMVHVLQPHEGNLGQFVAEDPRGKHLLPFLVELTGMLAQQRTAIVEELRSLGTGIEHMAELVRSQQAFSGAKGVFERSILAEEMDAAIRICSQALAGSLGIEFVKEYDEVPPAYVDKHKLMEILVNLIQNARHALAESPPGQRVVTLRLQNLDGGRARIQVEDNGIGIAPEIQSRIFEHGFTTKKSGHGFGLHVSANAATEMGGQLRVASDGPGQGAVFTLDLPIAAKEPAVAA